MLLGLARNLLTLTSRLLVIIALVSVSNAALAYTLFGSGVSSCGTWVNDRGRGGAVMYADEEWVLGFIAGAAWIGPSDLDPLHGLDANAVIVWIDNYCQAKPLSRIIDAAEAFTRVHPR